MCKNHPTLTLLVDDASPHDDVAELLEHLSIENLIEKQPLRSDLSTPWGSALTSCRIPCRIVGEVVDHVLMQCLCTEWALE